jgi:CHAT domain-containing protein/tetratricopeptide (TPR) repeat protein
VGRHAMVRSRAPAHCLAALASLAVLVGGTGCRRQQQAANRPPALRAAPTPRTGTGAAPATARHHETAPAPRVFRLARGPGLERALAGGKVDAFEIDLAAGQYLYATFEQRGVDVAVDVFGPDRAFLFEVDRPYEAMGSERVYLMAETRGRYRLEVRGLKGASPGHYLPRVEALRPATAADRHRAAAERAFCEARGRPGAAPSFWEAAAKFERALRLFEELGAKDRQAEAYYWLGKRYHEDRHDYREALDLYRSANALYRGLHDHKFIALSYNQIGRCHAELGEFDLARAAYRRAMGEWRTQPTADGHAVTLENLGDLCTFQGKTTEALRSYREAIDIRRKRGEKGKEAKALTHLAWVYRTVGDWSQALAALRPALELCHEARERQQRSAVLREFGKVHLDADEPRQALPYFEQAFQLEGGEGDPETRADTLAGLGTSYRRMHDYRKAVAVGEKALAIFHQTQNRRAEANLWISLGSAYAHLQQQKKVAECYGNALRLAHDTGYRDTEAVALLGAGVAARERRNLGEALADGEAALAMVETLRRGASRPDLQASYLALNEDYYGFLVGVLMQMHAMQPARGFELRALHYSEQARARILLDTLAARREARATRRKVDPALLAARQSLERRIAAKDRELRAPADASVPKALIDQQIEGLLEQLREVSDRIRGADPRSAVSSSGASPFSVTKVQRESLDDGTLLLEYYLSNSKSYLWAVTADAVASFELPGRDELDPLLRSTHQLLARSRGQEDQEAAASQVARLSSILLGQVADRLGERRLLIVANGALRYIPFAALPDPRDATEPLMLKHEIVYAPSLAVLAELRASESARRDQPGLVAILADPVFGTQDERARSLKVPAAMLDPLVARLPRLPHSSSEAEAIASLAGHQGVLEALGLDANTELVTSGRLRPYRILHFATHATLRADQPDLSALALSQVDRAGRPREGLLRTLEIADLDLPAELVVLSACETALGKELGDEGLVGLPQGFMSAGALRVLVSLWDVGDRSTAELMRHFYRGLLARKLTPVAALRAAQQAMWRDARWRAPCYWAGFVLEGDWRRAPVVPASFVF